MYSWLNLFSPVFIFLRILCISKIPFKKFGNWKQRAKVTLSSKRDILPPRQIKSTVRLCQRIKNRRRQIQTFDQNNN